MKYVKFNKDYPQTGNKEGDIIKLRDKVPPHLEGYVTEVQQTTYEKHAKSLREDDQKKADAILKGQQKAYEAQQDPATNTGDPVAAATDPLPDGSNVVRDTQDLELNKAQNRAMNPPEISRAVGESNEAYAQKRAEHNRRTEADEQSKKKGSKK